jgi:hypothetical protein
MLALLQLTEVRGMLTKEGCSTLVITALDEVSRFSSLCPL